MSRRRPELGAKLCELPEHLAAQLGHLAAKLASGAAVVVVSLHWGSEYDTAGTGHQRALAEELLASPTSI